jgi:L-ascorbate metabolism protein UlaG (beta-lactamase superfamily)
VEGFAAVESAGHARSLAPLGRTHSQRFAPRLRRLRPEGGQTLGLPLAPELALLPIGAYNPPQFRNVHANPADATRAFLDLKSRWMVPMHYGTFRLSHEPVDEPLQLLDEEARAAGIADRVVVMEEGLTRFF